MTLFPACQGGRAYYLRGNRETTYFQMAAKGFSHSNNKLSDTEKAWDNIHWWGARWETGNNPINPLKLTHISAPVVFFAVHFHWRWAGLPETPIRG